MADHAPWHGKIVACGLADYLGGDPTVEPKPVKTSDNAKDMLRFDLDNENTTALGEDVPNVSQPAKAKK